MFSSSGVKLLRVFSRKSPRISMVCLARGRFFSDGAGFGMGQLSQVEKN